MQTIAMPARSPASAVGPWLPSPRRVLAFLILLALLAAVSMVASTLAYLQVPAPSGPFAVGRTDALLVDETRREPAWRGGGQRAVRVIAWYPAEAGTGADAPYLPGYDGIREALAASGELSPLAVAGLPLVRTAARADAAVATAQPAYPVIALSPGNATNVSFYASLAEELASRGYVVLGVDHPYQSVAVDLGQGHVAAYTESSPGDDTGVEGRIQERIADLGFVLDSLTRDETLLGGLSGRLDLARVGVAGHSNGGLAAVGMCGDARVSACVNIDGQAAGGPFGPLPDPVAPNKPFLFLTKETGLHPALTRVFEAAGSDAYRVVVPNATHESFADGSRFVPRLAPIDGTADHVLTIERGFVAAFFDRFLGGASGPPFDDLAAPADVYVESYPLKGRSNLPAQDPATAP